MTPKGDARKRPLAAKKTPAKAKKSKPTRPRIDPLADVEEAEGLLEDLPEDRGARSQRGTTALKARAREWSFDQALHALRGTAGTITANLDQRSLVREILRAAIELLHAERGILFLGEGQEAGLVPVEALSISGEELNDIERVSRTILRRGQRGEVLVSEDAANDARFRDAPSIQLNQIRSVLCAPLRARGKPMGVLYLDVPATSGAFSEGAERFLEVFADLAAVALENARVYSDLMQENVRVRRRLNSQESFERLITLSPSLNMLLGRAALAARVDAPILLMGEYGSGKETIARMIHAAGPRALNPFVAHSCALVPREMMESLLFGHRRGAFPGAQRDMPGLLREADRGVFFLDEISDLEIELQRKLLRALKDGLLRPLGSRREFRVDIQLISATSHDIRADVEAGRLLDELYYRISVLEMAIPPLRERPEDIPLLVDHFIQKHAQERKRGPRPGFSRKALEYLQTLAWRGNVRELESLVRRALVMLETTKIDLPQVRELVIEIPEDRAAEAYPGAWPAAGRMGQVRTYAEQEREALQEALIRARGNKSKAARLLGLHRNTMLRRMKKLGVLKA